MEEMKIRTKVAHVATWFIVTKTIVVIMMGLLIAAGFIAIALAAPELNAGVWCALALGTVCALVCFAYAGVCLFEYSTRDLPQIIIEDKCVKIRKWASRGYRTIPYDIVDQFRYEQRMVRSGSLSRYIVVVYKPFIKLSVRPLSDFGVNDLTMDGLEIEQLLNRSLISQRRR